MLFQIRARHSIWSWVYGGLHCAAREAIVMVLGRDLWTVTP
jgi:hypothetical protein